MSNPKLFYLQRNIDKIGVSGEGRIAEGVIFSDGKCIIKWNTDISSIVIHDNIENIKKIHCHDNNTQIIWAL